MNGAGNARRSIFPLGLIPRHGAESRWRGRRFCCMPSRDSAIRFISAGMFRWWRSAAGRCFCAFSRRRARLLKNLPGVRGIASHPSRLPPCQAHCYLMDLPLAFGTRLETIPNTTPYLNPDPVLRESWAGKIPTGPDLKVGLAWAGRPTHASDSLRSIKLSQFAPLSAVSGGHVLQFAERPRLGTGRRTAGGNEMGRPDV